MSFFPFYINLDRKISIMGNKFEKKYGNAVSEQEQEIRQDLRLYNSRVCLELLMFHCPSLDYKISIIKRLKTRLATLCLNPLET